MQRRPIAILVLAGAAATGVVASAAAQSTATPMRDMFRTLLELLPYSLEAGSWNSPAHSQQIEDNLAALAERASAIEEHGMGLNASYGRARESMAADAVEAFDSHVSGDTRMSRFVVQNLTENCFACHSRLPAGEIPTLGMELREAIDVTALEPEDRLRLLTATRQFSQVLGEAEEIMRSEAYTAADIDLMGVFEIYLKIAVRVSRDHERPRAALWEFMQREDLPLYLADRVGAWIVALDDLQRRALEPTPAAATELLREANGLNEYLRDRRGLVHAIVASSLLHQYVQTSPTDRSSLAEAYYRLGVAESAISRSYWVPETEYFLESAIRAAPETTHALNAYTFLEQYVLSSYTGSSGTNVPGDVWDRLAELRELVERE